MADPRERRLDARLGRGAGTDDATTLSRWAGWLLLMFARDVGMLVLDGFDQESGARTPGAS
jgi:hypothetical protein